MSETKLTLIHTPKVDDFISKITLQIPFSYLWLYKRSLGNPIKVLDVGCGDGLLMQRISKNKKWKIWGIDVFPLSIKKARDSKIYQEVMKGDVVKVCERLASQKKKYDTVFCSQVIEHISKKEGKKLLDVMEKLAKKRVVVATPRGYMDQPEVFVGDNPYQHHKSGWAEEDFSRRGFKVYGLGLKLGWSEGGLSRGGNNLLVIFSVILSYLFSPFVYFYPSLAAGILCIKEKKE